MDLWGSSNLGGGGSSTATLPDQISNLACTGGTDGSQGTIDVSFTEVPATSFDLLKYYILIYKAGGIPQTPFDGTRITLSKGTAGAKLEYQITGLTFDQLYGVRVYPVSMKNQYQTLVEGATKTTTPLAFDPSNRVYYCGSDVTKIFELDPVLLTPIKTVNSPGGRPTSMGGTSSKLFNGDGLSSDRLFELDPVLLTPIKTVSAPLGNPSGVGGIEDTIFYCSSRAEKLCILDSLSLVPIKTVNSPDSIPSGIGGNTSKPVLSGLSSARLFELDPVLLTPIKTVNSPGGNPDGVGGNRTKILLGDYKEHKIFELDPVLLTPIKTVNSPSTSPSGIGGTK